MDSFEENMKSYTKKVKLVLVAIFVLIILLISFDLFVVMNLQKKYSDINQTMNASVALVNNTIDKQNFKLLKEGKMVTIEQGGFCLRITNNTLPQSPDLFNCSGNETNQEWDLSNRGELKKHNLCVTLINAKVLLDICDNSAKQQWRYIAGVLRNPEYDMCLEAKEESIICADVSTIETKRNVSTASIPTTTNPTTTNPTTTNPTTTNSTTIKKCQKSIIAAKCNPTIETQIFNATTIYEIDRFCTFKQGSHAFPDDGEWIVTNSGYMLNHTHWLTYNKGSLSYNTTLSKSNNITQKWEYTEVGQIKNIYKNVCVDKNGTETELNKCDSNLKSQRWICT